MVKRSYSSPENVYEIAILKDLYGALLPPRQREVAHLKFDEDLSLSEMAQSLNISRQGCDDAVKRCVKALLLYEEKLGFKRRLERTEALIGNVYRLLKNMDALNWAEQKEHAINALLEITKGGITENGV